jgi:hypothetical protein
VGAKLILIAIAVAGFAWWACRRENGLEINHLLLASVGFIFYCIFPVWLSEQPFEFDQPGLRLWQQFVLSRSDGYRVSQYLWHACLAFVSFAVGALLGGIRRPAPRLRGVPTPLRDAPISVASLLGLIAFSFYAWRARAELFTGYTLITYEMVLRTGTLAAVSFACLALALFDTVRRWSVDVPPRRKHLLSPALAVYVLAATVLIGIGSRLYVVSAILAFGVLYTLQQRAIRVRTLAIIAGGIGCLAGAIGVLRLGAPVTWLGTIGSLGVEPIFTSFSLFNLLGRIDPPALAWPRFLIGDLVNLVPTSIWPNKIAHLPDPSAYGYPIFAPLGALHAYVSWVMNFGSMGMVPVIGVAGYVLSRLRSAPHHAARVAYALASACCAFTVYRDPFHVSLVKNVLEFSFIVPFVLWGTFRIASIVLDGRIRNTPFASGRLPST